jgi:hypothetical protein
VIVILAYPAIELKLLDWNGCVGVTCLREGERHSTSS